MSTRTHVNTLVHSNTDTYKCINTAAQTALRKSHTGQVTLVNQG